MPEKKAPHGGGPIRGSGNDISNISIKSPNVKIPLTVIERLESEICGLEFGGLSLVIAVRDGHRTYRIEKTISVMVGGAND